MRTTTLLFASFIILSAPSYGQFKKGSTLLGGDLYFSTQTLNQMNSEVQKSNTFGISPVFAKAVKDNLFFGGSLSFASATNRYNPNGELKTQTYGASVFVRRYKSVFGKMYAFVQPAFTVSILDGESKQGVNDGYETKGVALYAALTPGISVGVSKKLYLEAGFQNIAQLGYSLQKQTGNSGGNVIDSKTTSFNFSSNLSTESAGLYFGVRFIIPH